MMYEIHSRNIHCSFMSTISTWILIAGLQCVFKLYPIITDLKICRRRRTWILCKHRELSQHLEGLESFVSTRMEQNSWLLLLARRLAIFAFLDCHQSLFQKPCLLSEFDVMWSPRPHMCILRQDMLVTRMYKWCCELCLRPIHPYSGKSWRVTIMSDVRREFSNRRLARLKAFRVAGPNCEQEVSSKLQVPSQKPQADVLGRISTDAQEAKHHCPWDALYYCYHLCPCLMTTHNCKVLCGCMWLLQ